MIRMHQKVAFGELILHPLDGVYYQGRHIIESREVAEVILHEVALVINGYKPYVK